MTTADDSTVPHYPDLLRLDGRTVVVAGAGQGIGRQTAHAARHLGADVVCVDVVHALAEEVAREVGGTAVVANACTRDGAQEIVDAAVETYGRLDGLVDIIGSAPRSMLIDTTDEEWDLAFELNLRHAFLLAQLSARVMAGQGGGALVFIASYSGMRSAPGHAAYGAAKAALLSLVRSAAEELGPQGIRVNAVAPGMTQTPRVRARLAAMGKAGAPCVEPLGRPGEPSDVAGAALFLLSDLARQITGHTIVVDGGLSVVSPHRATSTPTPAEERSRAQAGAHTAVAPAIA